MAFDQQIIEDDVDDAAGKIGGHGKLGIPAAPLGGVDDHGEDGKEGAAHDDPEILHGGLVGVLIAAGEGHDLGREDHEDHGNHGAQENRQHQGGEEDLIGVFPALLPLAAGDQGGNGNIEAEEEGQGDKLRLIRQAHGGDSIAAHGGDHHGIDHAGQGHEKTFRHGGPGNGECSPGHEAGRRLIHMNI